MQCGRIKSMSRASSFVIVMMAGRFLNTAQGKYKVVALVFWVNIITIGGMVKGSMHFGLVIESTF